MAGGRTLEITQRISLFFRKTRPAGSVSVKKESEEEARRVPMFQDVWVGHTVGRPALLSRSLRLQASAISRDRKSQMIDDEKFYDNFHN